MMSPFQGPQGKKQEAWEPWTFLIIVIVLLLIAGAIVWILSIEGFLASSWSSLLAAIFTAIGVVFTVVGVMIALQGKEPPLNNAFLRSVLLPPFRRHLPNICVEEINLGGNKRRGALIVKVKRKQSGATVNLYHGFDHSDLGVDLASNVVHRRVDGSPTYIAIFPALEPGNYTVSIDKAGLKANVTIRAGQVAEIDWRLYIYKKN